MSATHSKKTESKYVSCFADSRPDVDITFRDVLLRRPTDHYVVGVDNFSLTNSSLSMIEPMTQGVYAPLIRIVANISSPNLGLLPDSGEELNDNFHYVYDDGSRVDGVTSGHGLDVPLPQGTNFRLDIDSSETILSIQQLMRRLGDLAASVNHYMNAGASLAHANDFELGPYTPTQTDNTEHLKFELFPEGNIEIHGTKAFWGLFSVEIPSVRNQFGFYGPPVGTENVLPFTRLRQFLCDCSSKLR